MRRLTFGLAIVVAFLAGGLLMNRMLLQAQDKVEPRPRGQLYPKWKDLGLTRMQTDQIYKIQTEHRAKIAKLQAEIDKLKVDEKVEATKVLTPAQKARLKELLSGDTSTEPEKDKVAKPADKK